MEFVLDDRNMAMGGIYARQAFQSRWTSDEVERVRAWRSADAGAIATAADPYEVDGLIAGGESWVG